MGEVEIMPNPSQWRAQMQQQLVVPPNPNPTATATIASVESINQSINILVGSWTWQMWQEHVRAARRGGVNYYGVASSSNWSKSNLKRALRELQGLWRPSPPSKVNTMKPLNPMIPHGWEKVSGSLRYLQYDWVHHKWGRVHWKSSTRNVTHPSRYNFGLTDAG